MYSPNNTYEISIYTVLRLSFHIKKNTRQNRLWIQNSPMWYNTKSVGSKTLII